MSAGTRPPCPLSFARQQLWLLDRIRPGSAAYHVTRAFRLNGDLDVEAFGRALDAIVARHEDPRPDLGWRGLCPDVEAQSVPGDHLGAITRHVRATGARLRECLERAFPA